MAERKVYRAIGLMSGTSLDGVDAALLETDGHDHVRPLGFYTAPYDEGTRAAIRACFGLRDRTDARVKEAERLLTEKHVEAVKALLKQMGGMADLIGFHGQTITHDPDNRFTLQIGDADLLARETGVDVVHDFRSADVAAGGQGAPLLPLYHRARVKAAGLKLPVAIVNIGGVANVTWIGKGEDDILAFDTGPGNALMDDWAQKKTGQAYDEDGKLAAQGRYDFVEDRPFLQWGNDPYFRKKPPKSLDRNHWNIKDIDHLNVEDGAACLTDFVARSIVSSARHFPKILGLFPQQPHVWYISGGGRKNATLMKWLGQRFDEWKKMRQVEPVEVLGWNGDAIEAEGFAYLAVRSVLGLPLSLPTTTGVPAPMPGGRLARAV